MRAKTISFFAVYRSAGKGRERGLTDELKGRRSHYDPHAVAGLNQPADEERRLVGCDAPGDSHNNFLIRHAAILEQSLLQG